MSIYLGIDFGTSTNYVTRWNESDGTVRSVPNLDPTIYTGDEVFPNVIYYCQNGEKLVGQAAIKRASIDPRNGIAGVKRKFLEEHWEYDIPALHVRYSPVDVAAVISYGIFQRNSTMGHSEKIMVFDFGGGTLDITIFSYEKSPAGQVSIEVLNTEGLRDFGGQVIDSILCSKISAKAGIHAIEIADQDQRLRYQSEMTARVIQIKEDSQYWEEDDEEDIHENMSGIPVETTVTALEIENWLRGERVLEKIRDSVNGAPYDCGDKGLEPEDIDRVLLVGGSSNLTIVKSVLREVFGKEPETCSTVEINKMVGYGAGVYCGMKAKNNGSIKIIQKLSYSIGVRVGANFDKLIEKNARYGTFSQTGRYSLSDSKNNRDIEVYQGNSRDITKCFLIGKIPVAHLVLGEDKNIEIALGTTDTGMVAYKIYSNGKCLLEDVLK